MRTSVAAVVAACSLGASATASAQGTPAESAGPPVALVTGIVLLGAAYAPSYSIWLAQALPQAQCLSASQGGGLQHSCPDPMTERTLVIPLVGPWTTLVSGQPPGGQWTTGEKALLIADGLAQDIGFALAAYGVIRLFTAPRRTRAVEPPPAITVQPGAGAAIAGVRTVVTF